MRRSEILVGLDLGSSRIKVVVADTSGGELPEVLGRGEADSLGIEAGVIVNMERAALSIREAVEAGMIKPVDAQAAKNLMKYVPFWA